MQPSAGYRWGSDDADSERLQRDFLHRTRRRVGFVWYCLGVLGDNGRLMDVIHGNAGMSGA